MKNRDKKDTLRKIKILFFITCSSSLLFLRCASFSKKSFKDDFVKLTEKNIKSLNGEYYNFPKQIYGKFYKKFTTPKSLKEKNIYNFFVPEFKLSSLDSLNLKNAIEKIEINFKSLNQFTLKYKINEKTISKVNIEGKIKKGFFYLNDEISDTWGVPVIFGGYEYLRKRIGISKKGNLIINSSYEKGGSILIIFSNGGGHIKAYEVEKVK